MISKYLDAWELAEELHITQSTVMRRARMQPWLLPPPAHLGNRGLLRWREADVRQWKLENGTGS